MIHLSVYIPYVSFKWILQFLHRLAITEGQIYFFVFTQSKTKSTEHEPNPFESKCKKLQNFSLATFETGSFKTQGKEVVDFYMSY